MVQEDEPRSTLAAVVEPQALEVIAVPIPAAARLLSISERKVWYLIKAGKLPTRMVGRRRLVLVSELRRCLEEGLLADTQLDTEAAS